LWPLSLRDIETVEWIEEHQRQPGKSKYGCPTQFRRLGVRGIVQVKEKENEQSYYNQSKPEVHIRNSPTKIEDKRRPDEEEDTNPEDSENESYHDLVYAETSRHNTKPLSAEGRARSKRSLSTRFQSLVRPTSLRTIVVSASK
jgi:hypothetical protein